MVLKLDLIDYVWVYNRVSLRNILLLISGLLMLLTSLVLVASWYGKNFWSKYIKRELRRKQLVGWFLVSFLCFGLLMIMGGRKDEAVSVPVEVNKGEVSGLVSEADDDEEAKQDLESDVLEIEESEEELPEDEEIEEEKDNDEVATSPTPETKEDEEIEEDDIFEGPKPTPKTTSEEIKVTPRPSPLLIGE